MKFVRPVAAVLLMLLAACSPPAASPPDPTAPAAALFLDPGSLAEVRFSVSAELFNQSSLNLVVQDQISAPLSLGRSFSLQRQENGRWETALLLPPGTVLRYSYQRSGESSAVEFNNAGLPAAMRIVRIDGPQTISDTILAWSDQPNLLPGGSVSGRLLNAQNGKPIRQALITIAGYSTFSDTFGEFSLDNLPAGLQRIAVLDSSGAHQPAFQGVEIAADALTPVELFLQPANLVNLTFKVTVPPDTIPGAALRLAGNIRPLGNTYAFDSGRILTPSARLPVLQMIDSTHYQLSLQVSSGTDLHYRYTLGDGYWNAERDQRGATVTRRLLVSDHDMLIEDQVISWQALDQPAIRFYASANSGGIAGSDYLSLQFGPPTGDPLPMWLVAPGEWFFTLYSPLVEGTSLEYRYCRSLYCEPGDRRTLAPTGEPLEQRDELLEWTWQAGAYPATIVAPQRIEPRPDFVTGIELLNDYDPASLAMNSGAIRDIAAIGAASVSLAPMATWSAAGHSPQIIFDPGAAPFEDEIAGFAAEARASGLLITLRPRLGFPEPPSSFWQGAAEDPSWWQSWFEAYRRHLLGAARLAANIGASRLVIGGGAIAPALPGGSLPDGSLAPGFDDLSLRWPALITEIRQHFPGLLAFEIELGSQLGTVPEFLELVDEIQIHWVAPLSDDPQASFSDLQTAAGTLLDRLLRDTPGLEERAVILSVEYLSRDGAADACPTDPQDGCYPIGAFSRGLNPGGAFSLDLDEQATLMNAVLLEAYSRGPIRGFTARRYDPAAVIHDLSASIHGKPARDILWYWFPRIAGTIDE